MYHATAILSIWIVSKNNITPDMPKHVEGVEGKCPIETSSRGRG